MPFNLSFGKKEKTYIGVDLGAKNVKVAILNHFDGNYQIKDLLIETLPPQIFGGGVILDSQGLSERLKRMLKGTSLRNSIVITGTGAKEAITKLQGLEKNKYEKAIEKLVRDEARQSGISATEQVVDLVVLDNDPSSILMQALVIRAKKEHIVRRQQMFYNALLPVSIVDVDTIALINAYKHCLDASEQNSPTVILNIGYEYSIIIYMENGIPIVLRSIANGTKKLVDELSKSGSVDGEKGDDVLLSSALTNFHETSYKKWAEDLQKQVKVSIQSSQSAPRQFFVCGGGALLPSVADYLQDAMDTPVNIFNPINYMANPEAFDLNNKEIGTMFAIAIGLALRGGL